MSLNEPPPFQFREYRQSDFHDLCAIDRLCFSETIAYTPEEVALGLAQRGAFAIVAERENRVIGFVLACPARRRLGHIITIDVLPDFCHLGVGKRLMELAEQRFTANGVSRIVLEVAVQNQTAMRFYDRLGYSVSRLLPKYYADGSDAYLMEKSL